MSHKGTVFKASLLVAGTSMGGGMLALPVLTSLGGFAPSLVIYTLCWLFMMCTGLLLLEVSLWMKAEANLVSMAEKTLGVFGKIAAWVLYIFLFYCLTIAYMVGCGQLLVEVLQNSIPGWLGAIVFTALFAPLIYAGTRFVSRLNVLLMMGFAFFFFAFVFLGIPHVNLENLMHIDWSKASIGLPIAFTAFAYQGTVPTLITYLDDPAKTRKAIIIGSSIPLLAYILWQWLILGIVPTFGPGGLEETMNMGQTAVYPLKEFLNSPNVYLVGQFFAFFALVTSFIGVSLGLIDFLADGLDIKKTVSGKLLLSLIVFVPTLLIACLYPHIFLQALNFAGGFGCALLLGLLPILMVWVGRYHLGLKASYSLPGGKITLALLFIFVCLELFFEISHTL